MPRISVPQGVAPLARVESLAPRLRAAFRRVRQATLDETSLSLPEIEAIRVRCAQLAGCRACAAFRIARDDPGRAAAAASRLDEAFYAAVAGGIARDILTARERLVCELVERFDAVCELDWPERIAPRADGMGPEAR